MKTLNTLLVLLCLAVASWAGAASAQNDAMTDSDIEYYYAPAAPHDGIYFSTRGVVDNLCYGSHSEGFTYYLVYEDADAGLNYEAIKVTQETYAIVLDCLERGYEMCGTLNAVEDYETVIYTLNVEED